MDGMTPLEIIIAAIVLAVVGFGGLWLPRRVAAHLLTIGVAAWFVVGLIHLTYWLRGPQGPTVAILGGVLAEIGALGGAAGVPGLWGSRGRSSRREGDRGPEA